MMTKEEIFTIAMTQSAIDSNCQPSDFLSFENKIVKSEDHLKARKYLELPFICDFTSYVNNIVASVSKEFEGIVSDYLSQYAIEHCFETPNLLVLMEKLKPYNVNVCFMAEYFLPDVEDFPFLDCAYETKILDKSDFSKLYLPEWGNALSFDRKHLDILGVGAYHNGNLIGLAACSADCDTMWQIGVDVLPQYRKQGIAAALTNQLANQVLNRGVIPFYCCAWSNLKSVRNALKSGFVPAWVQMTVKSDEFIDRMNR